MGLVWLLAAFTFKRAVRTEGVATRGGHMMTIAIAFALLFSSSIRIGPLGWRILPPLEILAVAGIALTTTGIAFAIWARFYLAGNWSGSVTIKQDHTLVRTGPYAVVRHPIYFGLTLATLGTAIAFGEAGCFGGAVMAFAAFLAKARLEESFLIAHFGLQYEGYRKQVKAVIPFVV